MSRKNTNSWTNVKQKTQTVGKHVKKKPWEIMSKKLKSWKQCHEKKKKRRENAKKKRGKNMSRTPMLTSHRFLSQAPRKLAGAISAEDEALKLLSKEMVLTRSPPGAKKHQKKKFLISILSISGWQLVWKEFFFCSRTAVLRARPCAEIWKLHWQLMRCHQRVSTGVSTEKGSFLGVLGLLFVLKPKCFCFLLVLFLR